MKRPFRGLAVAIGVAIEAGPRLVLITAGLILLFLGSLFGVAISLKIVVDAALQHSRAQGIIGGAIAAVALSGGVGFISVGGPASLALQERVAAVIDRRLIRLTAAVPNLELQDRPEYLSKLRLLLDDRWSMNVIVVTLVGNVAFAGLLVAIAIILGMQQPLLALLPLLALPTMWLGLVANARFRRAEDATAEERRLGRALFDLAVDPGAGKELRIFGLRDELMVRQARAQRTVDSALFRAGWMGAALRAVGWAVFAVAYAVAVLVVVNRAVRGQATAGDVVLTIAVAAPITFVAVSAAEYMNLFQRALIATQRFRWLRDLAEAAARPPAEPAPIPRSLRDGIRLDRVGFTYPGTDQKVLTDVTLDLPAGSVVALVGENGAGKTTVVKLLSRLYDPTEGRISIDDVDLIRFPQAEWRERICAGFQDFVQFEVLARETVGVGDLPRVSDGDAVGAAMDRAGATDVLESLQQGLETQLGKEWEGGVEVSTGQWQKLALSRALMRDRPLLVVLDEPTASLDAEAEHALFERFARAAREGREARDRITLLVSHRFSTVRMADLIVVLDGGRVLEVGSHTELIARGGLYAELFEIQARSYR